MVKKPYKTYGKTYKSPFLASFFCCVKELSLYYFPAVMHKPWFNLQTQHRIAETLPHGLQVAHTPLVFLFVTIPCLFCGCIILPAPQALFTVCHTSGYHLLGVTSTSKVLVCSVIPQDVVDILHFLLIWYQAFHYFNIFHMEIPYAKVIWRLCNFAFSISHFEMKISKSLQLSLLSLVVATFQQYCVQNFPLKPKKDIILITCRLKKFSSLRLASSSH